VRTFEIERSENNWLHQSKVSLHESERKLKAYAEMAADWFWEQDAEFRFQSPIEYSTHDPSD
jgi:hypothetical protein